MAKPSTLSFDVTGFVDQAASQFRNLNPKEPGQWPPLPKIATWLAAAGVAVLAGWFLLLSASTDDLEALRQKEPALNVYKLNGALDPDKRNWIRATLVFSKDGKFELQYDYAPAKDGDKGAAPAAAAKKDAKKAPARKN